MTVENWSSNIVCPTSDQAKKSRYMKEFNYIEQSSYGAQREALFCKSVEIHEMGVQTPESQVGNTGVPNIPLEAFGKIAAHYSVRGFDITTFFGSCSLIELDRKMSHIKSLSEDEINSVLLYFEALNAVTV